MLTSFDNLQDFFNVFNNLGNKLHDIHEHCNIYVFKHGIEPKWEDPSNANGSKWCCYFDAAKTNFSGQDYDNLYYLICANIIGCTIPGYEHISGIIGQTRNKTFRVNVWFTTDNDELRKPAITALNKIAKEYLRESNYVVKITDFSEELKGKPKKMNKKGGKKKAKEDKKKQEKKEGKEDKKEINEEVPATAPAAPQTETQQE